MILDEVSTGADDRIALHPRITVLRGLSDADRQQVIAAVEQAMPSSGLAAVLRPPDLPAAASSGVSDDVSRDAEDVPSPDEGVVAVREAELELAEAAVASAETELAGLTEADDAEVADQLAAAKAAYEVTSERSATARRALVDARQRASEEQSARRQQDERLRNVAAERTGKLEEQRLALEVRRGELLGKLRDLGEAPDPGPVQEALEALRRLQQVKPKPSDEAIALADRWAAYRARISELPAPPAPPEWLVTPALAALKDAREALARAEAGAAPTPADLAKVEELQRAHGDVLEAEQRVMRKATRGGRRKLEQAHEAEQAALAAIGAATYGEYLQKVAPAFDQPGGEDRIEQARAAVADAEAVWEELHGGEATPEWTEAKEEGTAVRARAVSMLGRDPGDDELESLLRSHVETVVDTGWARTALKDALDAVGATVNEADDLESVAEGWLAHAPTAHAERFELDAELAAVDQELAAVEAQLSERQADVFFGADTAAETPEDGTGESTTEAAGRDEDDGFTALRVAVEEAEASQAAAEAAISEARRRADEQQGVTARRARAVEKLAERTSERDAARAALEEARAQVARSAAATPLGASAGPGGTLLEAELYLLARLAGSGGRPLVLDEAFSGISDATRLLTALDRAADRTQVVYLTDREEPVEWAIGLGERASVVSR